MNQMTERLVVGGGALALGLVIGWAVHGLTGHGTTTQTVTTYDDWRTACPAATTKDANCEIVRDIVNDKTKNLVARVAIIRDKGKPAIGITLPLGVILEAGMSISFGSDPAKPVPYRTCTMNGCVSEIMIDDKLQAALDAGKDGKLLFVGPDGKAVELPLGMKGYAAAQRGYRSFEAKRASWFWRMW